MGRYSFPNPFTLSKTKPELTFAIINNFFNKEFAQNDRILWKMFWTNFFFFLILANEWITKKISCPLLRFNNSIASQFPHQKHLDIFLDARITFEEYLKVITTKVNKTIGLLRKLQKTLPRLVLMPIYKAFVRPHLDYGDINYDEAYNETFHQKLEFIQYSACLVLSGAIRGSSREKLYHELGLESLQCRRWYRKLCLYYKIFKENKPVYLSNLIPTKKSNYSTRNTDKITPFHPKHNFFKKIFFHPLLLTGTN